MQKKLMVLALALAVAGLLPGCAGGGKDTSGTGTSVSRTGKSSMTTGEMQRAAQDYIRDARYEADVTFTYLVPAGEIDAFESQVTEKTAGRAKISRGKSLYFGLAEEKLVIFED